MPYDRLVQLLMDERTRLRSGPASAWAVLTPLQGHEISRAAANEYLLYCQLEFRMHTGLAEQSARRVIAAFGDSGTDLWHAIAGMEVDQWTRLARELALHRFVRTRANAVRQVAGRMVNHFDGNALTVWSSRDPETTLCNLAGTLRIGPQLARMCVLGLLEHGLLDGDGDVKADVHVCRVLGRAVHGVPFLIADTHRVQETLREMKPQQKWLLDLPLWAIGRQHCHASNPVCTACPIRAECRYARDSMYPG